MSRLGPPQEQVKDYETSQIERKDGSVYSVNREFWVIAGKIQSSEPNNLKYTQEQAEELSNNVPATADPVTEWLRALGLEPPEDDYMGWEDI